MVGRRGISIKGGSINSEIYRTTLNLSFLKNNQAGCREYSLSASGLSLYTPFGLAYAKEVA